MSAAPPAADPRSAAAASEAPELQDPELEQPVLLPPRGLVWVTLAALSLSAALAILYAPGAVAVDPPSLELNMWRSDEAELGDMRRRVEALLQRFPQPPAEELALRGAFAVWLAQEATQGQLAVEHDFDARLHLARAEEHARALVLRAGEPALQAAAARYGLEVRRAYEALLRGAAEGDAGATALDHLAPGMRAALRGTGIEAERRGAALAPAAQLVVEALAAQRLLALGARVSPRPTLPSDVELLLLRWRVEGHRGLPAERRAALLRQLEAIEPGYPGEFVAGVWAARDGDCEAALQAWQQALRRRQLVATTRANIRWCQSQLNQSL